MNYGDKGGGIYNATGDLTLTDVKFNGNTAFHGNGGGMFNDTESHPTLTNVTFSNNTADNYEGGGMYNAYGMIRDASPTLTNVTFSSNTADNGGGMYNDTVPNLEALADNGGPTQTIALGTGSSAIDAGGANAACASTAQRPAGRPYGSGCDIGAYEVHESLTVGDCSSLLDGPQIFTFPTSGNTVTVDVDTGDGLTCITVEEMGPGASHPLATGPGTSDDALLTNNWWHITGNITSGFSVDITLPYSSADADSRVCRWPGGLGGYGWDCDDGTNTSFGAGTVTRTGVDSFSDWAVGDHVGPTAVTLTTFAVDDAPWLPVGLLVISAAGLMLVRKRRSSDSGDG